MAGFPVKVEGKGKVKILSYPYRVGSYHPNSVSQIIEVLQILRTLHIRGYVHGDIRIENIIFSSNCSLIIDYDFARQKNELYENYNSEIPGRHS
jgi:serine/threonine protein kinase